MYVFISLIRFCSSSTCIIIRDAASEIFRRSCNQYINNANPPTTIKAISNMISHIKIASPYHSTDFIFLLSMYFQQQEVLPLEVRALKCSLFLYYLFYSRNLCIAVLNHIFYSQFLDGRYEILHKRKINFAILFGQSDVFVFYNIPSA